MFWTLRQPIWSIDPARVALGSVIGGCSTNLSRTHVRVRYLRTPTAQFLPLAGFIRRCDEAIERGRRLEVDDLLVAPLLKQRNTEFFDRLTDWGPATRRALGDSPRRWLRPLLRS